MSDNMDSRAYDEQDDIRGKGNIGLSLSQNIWDSGATSASIKSANANFESSNSLVDESATNIAFAAISAHNEVYLQGRLLQMAKNNVKEHLDTFHTVQQRFQQGISTDGEVEQIRSRVARAKNTFLTYEVALSIANSNYLNIVGTKPVKNILPISMPKQIFTNTKDIKEITIQKNPLIQKNLSNIKSLLGGKDFAETSNLPKLSIEVGPSYFDTTAPRDESNLSFNATLQLRWNLYNGGADFANVQANSASIRQARQELHRVMDGINEDIDISFMQKIQASKQAKEMQIAARSSRKSKKSFYQQFLAGKKGLLDVLDAESEAFSASIEALTYENEHVLGSYRLLALAGVLLTELGIESANMKEYDVPKDDNTNTYGMEWSTLNHGFEN